MSPLEIANQERHAQFMSIWTPRKEQLQQMYHGERMSQQAIARHFGVNQRIVLKAMGYLGIESRGKGRKGPSHHSYKDGRGNRDYRGMVEKICCEQCQKMDNLAIHHRNFDHYDNGPENLQVLCVSCHSSVHKQAWWDAKKSGQEYQSNAPVGWER